MNDKVLCIYSSFLSVFFLPFVVGCFFAPRFLLVSIFMMRPGWLRACGDFI